jgi:hypothetical protein
MRGYGRDYDNRGNWLNRAGETVRGWFGGGSDYDREYGPGSLGEWQHRDWNRGMQGGGMMGGRMLDGQRNNNWSNTRAGYDTVYRAGGYYGADYDNTGMRGGYDRDMSTGYNRGRMQGGGMMGGNRGYSGGGMGRGSMDRGGMDRGGMDRGGTSREWLGNEYGGGGYNAGNDWGDYNQGGWGGDLYRRSNQGGVEPGRHFRGYGHGSTSGSGYEPF